MELLSEEAIHQGHQYIIQKFLAPHFNVSMPVEVIRSVSMGETSFWETQKEVFRSSWLSNPNFRGTYSYESAKASKGLPQKLGAPLVDPKEKPQVLFAGEATHPHYFSTVHGAIESGYREADRLIQLYKANV